MESTAILFLGALIIRELSKIIEKFLEYKKWKIMNEPQKIEIGTTRKEKFKNISCKDVDLEANNVIEDLEKTLTHNIFEINDNDIEDL